MESEGRHLPLGRKIILRTNADIEKIVLRTKDGIARTESSFRMKCIRPNGREWNATNDPFPTVTRAESFHPRTKDENERTESEGRRTKF